jgi:signal transduction histidine kinase
VLELVAEPAEPLWLLGDALALEQLFLNLLLNAAQSLEPGGRATVVVTRERSELVVMVRDTGRGIPPEALERVLDRFFSTREDGTGLGLPIARQIAASHGGSLAITSKVGEGTTVEVRLPRIEAAEAAVEA